jgi:hypothetical protein
VEIRDIKCHFTYSFNTAVSSSQYIAQSGRRISKLVRMQTENMWCNEIILAGTMIDSKL